MNQPKERASRLKKAGALEEKPVNKPRAKAVIFLFLSFAILIFISTIGVGTYLALNSKTEPVQPLPEESTTTSITQTTTVPTSSTTSTSSTTTSTTTTTTTSTTTTTTLCGATSEKPCADGKCGEGYTIGSEGLCQPLECAPSVPSGKDGCGSFALNFCKSQA